MSTLSKTYAIFVENSQKTVNNKYKCTKIHVNNFVYFFEIIAVKMHLIKMNIYGRTRMDTNTHLTKTPKETEKHEK